MIAGGTLGAKGTITADKSGIGNQALSRTGQELKKRERVGGGRKEGTEKRKRRL